MAFNPGQYTQPKKKREVDPNAPPRPNLLSHEKKIKDTDLTIANLQDQLRAQAKEIESLRIKYQNMQSSVSQLINFIRKGK